MLSFTTNESASNQEAMKAGMTLNDPKSNRRSWLLAAVFVLYMTVLFYLVFLSEAYGRNNQEILRYQNMNLVPFKTISRYMNAWDAVSPMVIISNLLGNVLVFVPFGFLGPIVLGRLRLFRATFTWGLILSLMIEGMQGYLAIGVVDVDDVLLNVTGAVVGYILYRSLVGKH